MLKNTLNTMQQNSEPFRILYSIRRKHVAFKIGSDGILEIHSPTGIPETLLRQLPAKHNEIINGLRKKYLQFKKRTPEFTEGCLFPLLGRYYPLHLTHRLLIFDGSSFLIPDGTEEEKRNSLTVLFKNIAKKCLTEQCLKIAEQTGLFPSHIRFGSASGRWGCCTAKKVIVFSWRLIHCPPDLIDYVICHELAHLREMNHSKKFWQEVEKICPDYKELRQKLKSFSSTLVCL